MSMILVAAAFVAGLFMAWIIGATGASPPFGPANSAGATTIFRGSLVVGVAAFLGAVTQGGAVAETMRSGLVSGMTLTPAMATVILLFSSAIIVFSVITKYPIPTVFVVVGGVLGAGVAAGGVPNVSQLRTIGLFWLCIPFVAAIIGYGTASLLRKYVPKTDRNKKYIRSVLLFLAAYTAYTAGANQVGLAVGPLQNVANTVPVTYLLLFGGIGIMIGAWTGSPRIIEAIGHDYSRMGPRRAVAALLAASVLAQVATLYGVPVSFNEAILASIIGSGLVEGRAGVSKRKIGWTLLGWLLTLILAVVSTAAMTKLLLMF